MNMTTEEFLAQGGEITYVPTGMTGLREFYMKTCSVCKIHKERADCFSRAVGRDDGFQHACKKCNAAYAKNNRGEFAARNVAYQATKRCARPIWSTLDDMAVMKNLYVKSSELTKSTGVLQNVDHIIPLKGKLVCGLHIPGNLTILPKSENSSKSNKFDVTQDWAFSEVTQQLEVITRNVLEGTS